VTQPALWWQHHRMRPPMMTREMRWAVQRYPWGVAVWEKPLHWVGPAGMRVVDVVVTDPAAPLELAEAHAVERMPTAPKVAQRVADALPFPASARSVTAASVAGLLTVLLAAAAGSAWLAAVLPVMVVVLLLADRVLPRQHPAALRRRGHDAAAVPFTGRVQLADALCQRSAPSPYGEALRHAVRAALWECRADHAVPHGVRPRLDAWLDHLDEGDRLAAEVLHLVASAGAPGPDPGPGTVVDRAAAVLPDLVASLAAPSADHRQESLRHLTQLRDACAEAVEARDSLARTVGSTAADDLAVPGRSPQQEWVSVRVDDLLGDLRAEASILREVDAELRARDGRDVHGR